MGWPLGDTGTAGGAPSCPHAGPHLAPGALSWALPAGGRASGLWAPGEAQGPWLRWGGSLWGVACLPGPPRREGSLGGQRAPPTRQVRGKRFQESESWRRARGSPETGTGRQRSESREGENRMRGHGCPPPTPPTACPRRCLGKGQRSRSCWPFAVDRAARRLASLRGWGPGALSSPQEGRWRRPRRWTCLAPGGEAAGSQARCTDTERPPAR